MPRVYYTSQELVKRGAQINWIIGERSNGKSFDIKHVMGVVGYLKGKTRPVDNYYTKEKVIETIKAGRRFFLLRRIKEEIKTDLIESYFSDIDVMGLTDNKYNTIECYRRGIYLSKYDIETGKSSRGEKIGYYGALNVEQNFAGTEYTDVDDIIFEEAISRGVYLSNEPDKLMNFYCTVDRKRGTTRLWLIGNSISRICPYFDDWEIRDIINHQKQGTIEEKWITTNSYDDEGKEIFVKIAIEYCKDSGRSSFTIGKHKAMLNGGSWQTDPQPHLPKSYNEYKVMYKIMFQYSAFKFIAEYLLDNVEKSTCWFIKPYNGEIKDKIIVFSDIIKTSNYWQRDIYNPTIKNSKIRDLLKTFKENQIFYASDLCGTDFKQVIDFEIRK